MDKIERSDFIANLPTPSRAGTVLDVLRLMAALRRAEWQALLHASAR